MRFELFIAVRYLRARRRQAVIGLVTLISIAGVAAGVAALIIALVQFGDWQHPLLVLAVFGFVQALEGQPITLYGDGSQTRSFCFVDDLIEGFIRLMASPDDVTGPINLGNPREMTVRELAEMVVAMVGGAKTEIVYHPLPADDPLQRQPNITLAKDKLGWEPRITLEQGLERTIAYFRERMKA